MIRLKHDKDNAKIADTVSGLVTRHRIDFMLNGKTCKIFLSKDEETLRDALDANDLQENRDYTIEPFLPEAERNNMNETEKRIREITLRMLTNTSPVKTIKWSTPKPVNDARSVFLQQANIMSDCRIKYSFCNAEGKDITAENIKLSIASLLPRKMMKEFPDILENCLEAIEKAVNDNKESVPDTEILTI